MMPFKKIIGILACDPRGVIGKDNGLPWHYPDELEHFRRTTSGHALILGRKTFESMPPKAFTHRLAIVFSENSLKEKVPAEIANHVMHVDSLQKFRCLDIPQRYSNCGYLAGGAKLAHDFLINGLVSEFLLTRIKNQFEGDTVFNLSFLENWPKKIIQETDDYIIEHLKKPGAQP